MAEEKIKKKAAARKMEEAEARRRQEEEARRQRALQQVCAGAPHPGAGRMATAPASRRTNKTQLSADQGGAEPLSCKPSTVLCFPLFRQDAVGCQW